MEKITRATEKWIGNLMGNAYESITIERSVDPLDYGRIKVELYQERWRTPEETISLFKEAIAEIAKLSTQP